MKSIRTRIITVFIVFALFIAATLTVVSVISINSLNRQDSNQLLEHLGRESASNIDQMLTTTEHSVNNIYYYAYDQLAELFGRLYSIQYREEYLEKVSLLALSEARGNDYARAVHYRLSEDIKDEPYGVSYQRVDEDEFAPMEMVDLSAYSPDDLEHVGWYHIPKAAKEPVWIGPYYNAERGMRMITYVVPVYVYGRFAGVIGMDIDINVLCEELREITIYNTGSAVMFDIEENILYERGNENGLDRADFGKEENTLLEAVHGSLEGGHPVEYTSANGDMKLYARTLVNGMTLCVTAPLKEINATRHTVLLWSVIFSVIVTLIALIITYLIISSFLKPLKELTEASRQLSEGNFDVHLHHGGTDEISQLSDTFELMSGSLKRYYDHFHNLAYTDALTGLNNKAAFVTTKEVIESELKLKRASFTVVVMDVNNLKTINDSIGHEKGDELLRHVTQCMRQVFVGFPLYRIGGDEFCSVVNNVEAGDLIERLQSVTARRSTEDYDLFHCHYQIAAGAATYDRELDECFDDTFNRADQAMYENKKYLKEREKNASKSSALEIEIKKSS